MAQYLNKAKIIENRPVSVRTGAKFKVVSTRAKKISRPRQDFHTIMMTIPGIVQEHKFHPKRRWRLDYYHPESRTAFEYEGIFSGKSRHTSFKGYTGDADKYNEAQRMGIRVFRFTAKNYQSVINYLP